MSVWYAAYSNEWCALAILLLSAIALPFVGAFQASVSNPSTGLPDERRSAKSFTLRVARAAAWERTGAGAGFIVSDRTFVSKMVKRPALKILGAYE